MCLLSKTERFAADIGGVDPSKISPPPEWRCPDHPEISISWASSPDGGGGYDPSELTITLPQGAKEVKISPTKKRAGEAAQKCIDFRKYSAGLGSNPRIEYGAKFEVYDAPVDPSQPTGIVLAPKTHIVSSSSSSSTGIVGLDCGYLLEVTLPYPSLSVKMVFTNSTSLAYLEAFNADGSTAGNRMPIPQGSLQQLIVKGTAISRIVLYHASETLLHEVCFSYPLLSVTGYNQNGTVVVVSSSFPSTSSGGSDSEDSTIEIAATGEDITIVKVKASDEGPVQIEKVCVVLPPDPVEIVRRQEMSAHLVNELAHWSQVGYVFEPDTMYRLKIETKIEAESDQQLNGWIASGNKYKLQSDPRQKEVLIF